MNSKKDLQLFDDAFYEVVRAMDSYMDQSIGKIRDFISGIDLHMYENDSEFVVEAYLPGYDRNQVQIEVLGNQLRIVAEKSASEQYRHDVRGSFGHEQSVRKLERYVSLPFTISEPHTKASFEGDTLKIITPRMKKESRFLDIE
ncbi:Hsp20/alpha crystallin family protein [Halobacillus locisalis]|uniref:Hsp20/alpha crystallin family protein n=1 Tax=Halobacillus locisalis TaxID=220753 RepID=A0A838CRA1_9BACI|nr:Hsp20/alpha crystallin family protein [Halobacillus locisalis]MBA2174156.1 Hsp20/alpha crystallin family protein [Halobacillus locisalis]